MQSKLAVAALFVMGMTAAHPGRAAEQAYPNKPVRVVTSAPGSSLDMAARIAAQGLSASLGQQVIVDNRPVLTVEIVAKALPDGYTLLVYGSPMWIVPFLQKVDYDPVRNFAPVTQLVMSPNALVIHPSVAATSVKELIALAKAKPGALNYGSSVTGGSPHLAAELFKHMAGVDIVRIPYKGVPQALTDVVGGRLQMMFPTAASAQVQVKAGKLKALAVTSAKPFPSFPELPTMAAAGLPGYEFVAMQGMLAPAGTPAAIVNRLQQDLARFLRTTEIRDVFLNSGSEAIGDTPAQFAATIKADITRMGKLIKDTGMKAE
jgi:tripartite-type tricarboxylate transporter receptor subunit TctC